MSRKLNKDVRLIGIGTYHMEEPGNLGPKTTVLFTTTARLIEVGIDSDNRDVKYIFYAEMNDDGPLPNLGKLLYRDDMSVVDIAELLLPSGSGGHIKDCKACTNEELQRAFVEALKSLVIDVVDDALQ